MRLTPIEIRSHRFNSRLRGYDTAEVEAFLETVVQDFEDVVRENAQLRRDSDRLTRELQTLREREKGVQDTLITAQGVVDQLKRTAVKEAEVLVSEAELRAEKLLGQAEARRGDLLAELSELRRLRTRLRGDLRRSIESYLALLDAFDEADAPDPGKPPLQRASE